MPWSPRLRYSLIAAAILATQLLLWGCPGTPAVISPPAMCQDQPQLTPDCFDALYLRYRPLLQASVQVAVGTYLAAHPDRAMHVVQVSERLQEALNQQGLTTLGAFEVLVRQTIDWGQLPPAQQIAVQGLLTAVRTALEDLLFRLGVLQPAQVRLIVHDLVTWTHEAAVIRCPVCLRELRAEGR